MRDLTAKAIRDRALELARTGCGVRAVAERLAAEGFRVGKSSVHNWVTAAAKAPERGAREPAPPRAAAGGARPARPSLASSRPLTQPPPLEGPAAGMGEAIAAAEEQGDLVALEALAVEVAEMREEAKKILDVRTYSVLVGLQIQLRTSLFRLRPPPPVDPLTDPTNLEARRIVLARLAKAVENAEAARQREAGAVAAASAA